MKEICQRKDGVLILCSCSGILGYVCQKKHSVMIDGKNTEAKFHNGYYTIPVHKNQVIEIFEALDERQ